MMGDSATAALYADALAGYGYNLGGGGSTGGISAAADAARSQGLSFDGTIRYLQDQGYDDDDIIQVMTEKQNLWR